MLPLLGERWKATLMLVKRSACFKVALAASLLSLPCKGCDVVPSPFGCCCLLVRRCGARERKEGS